MKLTSFTRNGNSGYGVVVDDGIIDLTTTIDDVSDLKGLLESNRLAQAALEEDVLHKHLEANPPHGYFSLLWRLSVCHRQPLSD